MEQLSNEQATQSLMIVYEHYRNFFSIIPYHDVTRAISSFRCVLYEYGLLKEPPTKNYYVKVVLLDGHEARAEALKKFKNMLLEISEKAGGVAVIEPAIAEIDFLLTAEALIDAKEF